MDKKHEFIFRTANGELTVGTDDIYELSQQDWFTKFLGVTASTHRPVENVSREAPANVETYDRRALQRDVRQMVDSMVREAANEIMAEKKSQPPVDDLPPPLPDDFEQAENFEHVAREAERELKQTEAEMARPDIRRDMPPQRQANFLDITPNKMTEQMWKSLSPEQQQQYGQKYMS